MFCPECGAKNQDNAVFCENCGADISQAMDQSKMIQPATTSTKIEQVPEYTYIPMPENQTYTYQVSGTVAKTRTPMKLKTKILLAVLLLVAVLIAVFFYVGNQLSSPEKAANNYFESLKSKDWNKTYSYLNISDSDFINKDNFTKMQSSNTNLAIVNYTIYNSNSAASASKNSTDNSISNALAKTIEMQYTTSDSSEPQTMEIKLIKQPQKMWFFFDTWKISPADYISQNVSITIPSGAAAYLNDVKIPDQYKSNSNDSSTDSSSSSDSNNSSDQQQNQCTTYTVKNIFSGKYTLKVTSQYTEDYTQKIEIKDNAEFNVNDLKLKKETLDTVSKQSGQIIQDVYAAALAGKDFSSISNYFVTSDNDNNNIKYEYQNLQNTIATGTNSGFKNVTFSNFQPEVTDSHAGTNMSITVDTKFDYSFTATSIGFGDQPSQDYTGNNSSDIKFTFTLVNGTWLVNNTNGLTISTYGNSTN